MNGVRWAISRDLPDNVPAVRGDKDGQTVVLINYNCVQYMTEQQRMDMLNDLFPALVPGTGNSQRDELSVVRERRRVARMRPAV